MDNFLPWTKFYELIREGRSIRPRNLRGGLCGGWRNVLADDDNREEPRVVKFYLRGGDTYGYTP